MGRMKKREVRMQHILPMRVSWHQMNESLHTNIFTPREYQVELVSCALQRNIIVCLGSATAKFFIATSVIRDLAYQVRHVEDGALRVSVVLAVDDKGVDHFQHCITRTSDLEVDTCLLEAKSASEAVTAKWASKRDLLASLKSYQVLVVPSEVFLELLKLRWISFRDVNLLVLDDCHNAVFGSDLSKVMRMYEAEADNCPNLRLLGLTASILSKECEPHQVQDCIMTMERGLKSHVEAASEITSILRLSSKCQELIVECPLLMESDLSLELRQVVTDAQEFLRDHVYDPCAVYGEEMVEECFPDMNDPHIDPLNLLTEFLEVLDTLGPWAAFTAAVYLMIEAEKLKKKTPHERHYLLLCVVFSVFLKIRAICDDAFKPFTPVERVFRFSTPKVRRLIEILHQYRLSESGKLNSAKIMEEIERADCKDPTVPSISVEDANMLASTTPIATSPPKTLRILASKAVAKAVARAEIKPSELDLMSRDALECLRISGDGVEAKENCKSSDEEEDGEEEEEEATKFVVRFPRRRRRRQRQNHVDPEVPHKLSKAQEKMERLKATYDFDNPRCLSCLVFVDKKWTAKILFALLKELSCHHPDFWALVPFFTAGTTCGEPVDFASKEAELDHKKQEEVLRRFRMHECNVLVSTSILEEGADIPRANLVVRFDVPSNFPSYVHSMGRCRSTDSRYVHLVPAGRLDAYLSSVAKYRVMAEMLLSRCHYHEAPIDAGMKPKLVDSKFPSFIPGQQHDIYGGVPGELSPKIQAGITILPLSKAVGLLNRYCAKLPSDTFTRLTPLWRVEKIQVNGLKCPCFKCHLRLPINCPVKKEVEGPVMPAEGLAKMAAAQLMCKVLHNHGELDSNLNPVGKEALKGAEVEVESSDDEDDANGMDKEDRPRPGTTKRRQYYYKKVSDVFRGCTPRPNEPAMLYKLVLKLACPIPEEHNTRGRKIHAPEQASQSFGILTTRHVPNISGFPIFTRSGEVGVKVKLIADNLVLSEEELKMVAHFHVFTFREVLRLEKYPMMFDPPDADMGFYIAPLANLDIEAGVSTVDWTFLGEISNVNEIRPRNHPDEERKQFVVDGKAWVDSVVMPWYRSQDQPQYFYVAEICAALSPKSQFPDEDFESFEKYYFCKYGIQIQNLDQPLLDVDLTSARLNLLTPRYVNRKGVALPTCSEATKKARRENLQQKVILVPELCDRHPFPASLWRQAVCLPCILYRMNCLLLADELRARVADEMRFGLKTVPDEGFDWPQLGFGWSLADVIKKQKEKAALKEKERGERHKSGSCVEIVEITEVSSSEEKEGIQEQEEEAEEHVEDKEETVEIEPIPATRLGAELDSKQMQEEPVKVEDDKGLLTSSELEPEEKEEEAIDFWVPPEEEAKEEGEKENEMLEKDGEKEKPVEEEPKAEKPEAHARSKVFEFSGPSLQDKEKLKKALKDMMEIGTWSNDMAERAAAVEIKPLDEEPLEDEDDDLDLYDPDISLPMNLEMITRADDALGTAAGGASGGDGGVSGFRYGSPSNFETGWGGWDGGGGGGGGGWGDAEASIHPWGVRTSNWDSLMRDLDGALDSSESDWGDNDEDDWRGIEFTDSNTAEAKDRRNRGQSVANGFKPEMDIYVEPREELDWESLEESEYADWKMEDLVEATNQTVEAVKQRLLTGADSSAGEASKCLVIPVESPVKLFGDGATGDGEEAGGKNKDVLEDIDTFRSLVRECKEWEESGRKSRSTNEEDDGEQGPDDSMFFRAAGIIVPRGEENSNWVNFDQEADPETDPGPNPSILLQALTMSNANDGINLERLETVGDSFLKFSVTTFLFLSYLQVHEGKLSYLRSKQVSNVHLYRLGKRRGLGERMVATKFEPHDNWLPPGYRVPPELEQALIESGVPEAHWNLADLPDFTTLQPEEIRAVVKEKSAVILSGGTAASNDDNKEAANKDVREVDLPCFLPYNLLTQHSIPDKSVADCVEALIGAYLTSCGMRGALLFMSWLGVKVLPVLKREEDRIKYGRWQPPPSPLVGCVPNPMATLDRLLDGYDAFERVIGYRFYNRAYLLQAFTHASYYPNQLTDCYQRLEFLGDAVLDYLITRHLYEDPRRHSPGALTDLRSALVNNTIFASLAVKFDFHKYFKHLSPGLWTVVEKFVAMQEENFHEIDQEFYWLEEEEVEEAEDVEVPKALGDVFESIAGAIYLDSGLSLDAVWTVYYRMMREQIEKFSACVPKSPIRELLEMEPETAKFGKPERLLDGRVRVSVEVFGKGTFRGIGRNYRIAKSTAAKCALRALKKRTAALSALR